MDSFIGILLLLLLLACKNQFCDTKEQLKVKSNMSVCIYIYIYILVLINVKKILINPTLRLVILVVELSVRGHGITKKKKKKKKKNGGSKIKRRENKSDTS